MGQGTEPFELGKSRSERIDGKAHNPLRLLIPFGMRPEASHRYAQDALRLFVLVVGHGFSPRWLELTCLVVVYQHDAPTSAAQELTTVHARRCRSACS
jgi:hypothetical protein